MSEPQARLEQEIGRLRERLESAEEMHRAIVAEEVDGFVVGEEFERVVLLGAERTPRPFDERLPHTFVTVSRAGDVLYASRKFASLLGRPLAQLFGSSLFELIAPEHGEAFRRYLVTSVPEALLEFDLIAAAGNRLAVRAVAVTVDKGYTSLLIQERFTDDRRDDAQVTFDAIAKGDIDGVVVGGEHIVLTSEAHHAYRRLVERMEQGAVTVSRNGEILYANDRFAQIVIQTRESLLGKQLDAVMGSRDVDNLIVSDGIPAPIETTLVRRDGTLLRVGMSAERVEDVDALTLIVTDLSERERHVQIAERSRRNDQFLAVLAHELRNPLGSIRNAVEILSRSQKVAGADRHAAEVISRQSETLSRLVDDLLDVHRLNEGKIVLQRRRIDARRIVDDAVLALRDAITAKRQQIDVVLPNEPLHVDADAVRLAQVLGNLLLNASKFTAQGGRIDVIAERAINGAGPVARIRVSDNGIGISKDQLERIFEPYVQAAGDTTGFPEGLGLGLSVSKRLIELHGGVIRATSEGPGHGSTFYVELELCDGPGDVDEGRRESAQSSPRVRILIADDDRDAAESLSSLLGLLGHETYTAHNGESAVALADEVRPDVAILDIGMPKIDGYNAAELLRARSWARDLVLYALTGWGEAKDRDRARRAGFDRHFVKPVDPDELARDLRERLKH
jgi:PAS domain S-box-containing protein